MAISNKTVSFTFEEFDQDQEDLIFQGDASINSASHVLQLTKTDASGKPVGSSVGRALYSAPIRLWKSSAVVASFETTFTFVISAPPNLNDTPADGFTFFLAPPASTIPPGSNGALLGVYTTTPSNVSHDNVVAIEFDTYPNRDRGDPGYQHIGINVNSLKSLVAEKWEWKNEAIGTAYISYNSLSKKLSAVTTYPNSKPVSVSYDIELNTVLPEWVRVGFSGATGQHAQKTKILSWSFSSSLKTIKV